MRRYVLALDGGGTKTAVALADDEGNFTLLPSAGGINAVDNPDWERNLDEALAPVFDLGVEIAFARIGMPAHGESRALDKDYQQAIEARLGPRVSLSNDVFMAYDGAFATGEGVLALAGTGSMAVTIGHDGVYRRSGGFGHDFGDEGSAYWIGRKALQIASWAVDGRRDAPEFLDRMAVAIAAAPDAPFRGLLEWQAAQKHPRSAVAALARHVDSAAADGDAVAGEILAEAADHVARLVVALRKTAELSANAPWSYAGGLFKSTAFLGAVTNALGMAPVPPAFPPLGGGLLRAARSAGWDISPEWHERVRAGLSRAS